MKQTVNLHRWNETHIPFVTQLQSFKPLEFKFAKLKWSVFKFLPIPGIQASAEVHEFQIFTLLKSNMNWTNSFGTKEKYIRKKIGTNAFKNQHSPFNQQFLSTFSGSDEKSTFMWAGQNWSAFSSKTRSIKIWSFLQTSAAAELGGPVGSGPNIVDPFAFVVFKTDELVLQCSSTDEKFLFTIISEEN